MEFNFIYSTSNSNSSNKFNAASRLDNYPNEL